jgi:hypothetical protein
MPGPPEHFISRWQQPADESLNTGIFKKTVNSNKLLDSFEGSVASASKSPSG